MRTSDDGLSRLTKREGKRNKAYKDVKGIWTNGVGHTGTDVFEGQVVDDAQVEAWLRDDVVKCETCVNSNVHVPLLQNQFDALVSFIFNVGVNAFIKSTMLKKLNSGDYQGAANEFDKWHIPASITGRRDTEKQQFLE